MLTASPAIATPAITTPRPAGSTLAPVYVPTPDAAARLAQSLEEPRPRFIAHGATGIFVAWTLTATIAPMLALFGLGESPAFYLLELVPIVGPLVAPLASRWSGVWWAYGALASTLQITGWITLIVGLANRPSRGAATPAVRARVDGLGITF
ncbi:MAG: hypothetical protein M3Y87_19040 [Myxococcota bacterium]|nr:hypothetical protein [Myxococcota bacterium]